MEGRNRRAGNRQQLQQLLSCLHQPIQRAQAKISIQSQPGLTLTTHVASFNLLFYFLIFSRYMKGKV